MSPTIFGIITKKIGRPSVKKTSRYFFYSVSADRYLSSSSMLEYGISIRGMPTA